jgi:polyribonucleotide nucleotidyltransferase
VERSLPRFVNPFIFNAEYKERSPAFNKIPMNQSRRDNLISERESYIGTVLEKSLRPLFHPEFAAETQLSCTVLNAGNAVDGEVLAVNAAATALALGNFPFDFPPLAAVRVAKIKYYSITSKFGMTFFFFFVIFGL